MRPMTKIKLLTSAVALVALTACATEPYGPTVSVMPPPNKPWAAFQEDQAVCTQYAHQSIAGEVDRANNRAVGAAVIGTALGAGLGAAAGGGRGAAIGAGAGAVAGTAVGAGTSSDRNLSIQDRYDMSYTQCMYSRGNQVPGYNYRNAPPGYGYDSGPGYNNAPPPPPGYPPPPPPPRR